MIIISLILGCIILMYVEENSIALESLREKEPWWKRIPWAVPMSEYNCYLREICTPGGPRACAWDEMFGYLAYFKDICAMYQFNCNAKGRFAFVVQNNIVCKVKHEFVGKNKTVYKYDLPTVKTTRASALHGLDKTIAWWWQGSTTDQYKYLQNMEVNK